MPNEDPTCNNQDPTQPKIINKDFLIYKAYKMKEKNWLQELEEQLQLWERAA